MRERLNRHSRSYFLKIPDDDLIALADAFLDRHQGAVRGAQRYKMLVGLSSGHHINISPELA